MPLDLTLACNRAAGMLTSKRQASGALATAFDTSAHAMSREYSSKRRQAPPPLSYAAADMDMEEEDDDEYAAAAGALLALQTATHASPSNKKAPGPQRRAPRSPAAEAAAAAAAAAASKVHHVIKAEDARMSSSLPGDLDAAELQQLDCSRVHGHPHKGGLQEPQTSNNIASGSCGSAKDTFVGTPHEADFLEDMEVTVVSETEKGCQVWFPPLPNEIEMRRRRRGSESTGGGLKRKYSGYNGHAHYSTGAGDDGEAGACSGGADEEMDLPSHAVAPLSAHRGGGGRGSFNDAAEGGPSGGSTHRGGAEGGSNKRQRFIWTHELHERFVAAVQQLGVKTAVPKAILTLMKVEGMTRENVASHLQKFRMALRRMEQQQQQGGNGVGNGVSAGSGSAAGRAARSQGASLVQEDGSMLSHAAKFTGGGGVPGPAVAAAGSPALGGQDVAAHAPHHAAPHQGLLLDLAENSRKQAAARAAASAAAEPPETQPAPAATQVQGSEEAVTAAYDAALRGSTPAAIVPSGIAQGPLNFAVLSPELLTADAKSSVMHGGQASPAAAALAAAAGLGKPNAAMAAAAMAALAQQQGQALQLVAGAGRLPVALQQHGQVLQLVSGQGGVGGFQMPVCYSLQPLLAAADLDPATAVAAAAHFAASASAAAAAAAAAPIVLAAAPIAASAQLAAALPAKGEAAADAVA